LSKKKKVDEDEDGGVIRVWFVGMCVIYIIFIYVWGAREGGVHELAHFPTILIYTRETDGEENYYFFFLFKQYNTHTVTAQPQLHV